MKCKLKEAMAIATRARIDGTDWTVVAGDKTISLRRPSLGGDPRVAYVEMKFAAEQDVLLEDGRVSATRSDRHESERVSMWLFREVAVTSDDVMALAASV